MPPWLVSLLVLAAGGGGFLLKRWIERRPDHERLERREKVLAIRTAMQDQGLTVGELDQFERVLLGEDDPGVVTPDDEAVKAIADAALAGGDRGLTQAELNELAHTHFVRADTELRAYLNEWRAELPPSRQALLDESQRAWESFRDAQASFSASSFEGGTIQPTIYGLARETLTRQRQAELASLRVMEEVRG